ncbi:MAG: phosphoenolpyruvate carboxykinase (ATP) [Planctomycetes bacterium]|nr:phosphoenolpyruvate carboxykinase (ATP) [Planctomycetota bacterium]MBI3834455.1 phosphoenolpyruvate carboxykinase (ATP) [Planctomycetota bacterium]
MGLDHHGFVDCGEIHWNLPAAELYEQALRNQEAQLANNGAIVCRTGKFTGRSPNDKFFVDEPGSHEQIAWGKSNRPMSEAHFNALLEHFLRHCRGRRLYVRDMFAGADESSRLPIRVITELAWHNLFASQLFIRPAPGSTTGHEPKFTVISVPSCQADPSLHGTNSKSFIVAHMGKRMVLIGGTSYAGEIKKSIFTVMNYMLPTQGVLSMHCSANVGRAGDVALFFGLSGTGKTTLSADSERRLIGDDEHGWSDHGVFNIEGGCYAKCIRLSPQLEPQIYKAIRFGAVLENVAMDEATRMIDYHSSQYTENTRAAYPLEHIEDAVLPSVGGHPRNIVFLTCDAFGVLPPIAKLSQHHAMYHFLSGYTAKIAGTEAGVTEPQATFSACFSAPFIPLAAERYATMLGEKLTRHRVDCWLVNTGWSGGGVGVGDRISLRYTRALVSAALAGRLNGVPTTPDPVFGIMVPQRCPDVPTELLTPRSTWSDPIAYDSRARHLAELFSRNFQSFRNVSAAVAAAGPQVGAPVRA